MRQSDLIISEMLSRSIYNMTTGSFYLWGTEMVYFYTAALKFKILG